MCGDSIGAGYGDNSVPRVNELDELLLTKEDFWLLTKDDFGLLANEAFFYEYKSIFF